MIILGIVSAACSHGAPAEQVDPGLVKISTERVIRHGEVGHDEWAREATYVLVDADNTARSDLFVTLGGTLRDADGRELGALRPESLRMPPGSRRLFVLVDASDTARPDAATADVVVKGAAVPTWQPTAHLADGYLHHDQGKALLAANLTNDADRGGRVIVFGAFYDAAGRPLQRQFTVAEIGAKVTQVVRFVGPEGSTKGAVYLGDATY